MRLRKRQRGFLLAPYRFGPSAPPAAELIGTAFSGYSVGTSSSATIPAAAEEDDLLLAFVMHRAALTAPAGWTLVATQSCTGSSSTVQYTSVYKRIALAGDASASTTWTQASSQRFAVHLHAWRRDGACDVLHYSTAFESNKTVGGRYLVWAEVTSDIDGGIGIACASSVVGNSAGNQMVPSSGTLTTPSNTAHNRLGVAWMPRNDGQGVSGSFDINMPDENGIAAVSLIVG